MILRFGLYALMNIILLNDLISFKSMMFNTFPKIEHPY